LSPAWARIWRRTRLVSVEWNILSILGWVNMCLRKKKLAAYDVRICRYCNWQSNVN